MSSFFSGPKRGDRPDAARYLPEGGSPGRPKGSQDRISRTVKENILTVFDGIGGTKAMINWARRNKTEFYKLYARLMPTQITATVDLRDASEFTDSELAQIIAGASGARAVGEETGEGIANGFH